MYLRSCSARELTAMGLVRVHHPHVEMRRRAVIASTDETTIRQPVRKLVLILAAGSQAARSPARRRRARVRPRAARRRRRMRCRRPTRDHRETMRGRHRRAESRWRHHGRCRCRRGAGRARYRHRRRYDCPATQRRTAPCVRPFIAAMVRNAPPGPTTTTFAAVVVCLSGRSTATIVPGSAATGTVGAVVVMRPLRCATPGDEHRSGERQHRYRCRPAAHVSPLMYTGCGRS